MVMLSPVEAALVIEQEVPCLIGIGSEVTVMEYDLYAQRSGTQDQLNPYRLFLKTANKFANPGQRSHLGEDPDPRSSGGPSSGDSRPSKLSSAYCSGYECVKGHGLAPLTD